MVPNKRQRTRAGAKPTVAESIAHGRDTEMAAHEAVAALMSMRHADLGELVVLVAGARVAARGPTTPVTAAPPAPLPGRPTGA